MSAWLIAFVGFIYLAVAVEQFFRRNYAMAIVFAGYAASNVGLYVIAKG